LTPLGGIPIGRYVLLDRIGEGGMAEVFAAVSFGAGSFRRFFVVKRLRSEMANNPTAVAHFIDEANLASTLVHPNIVPVFDFGEVQGVYFLAQEYIAGRDLGRLRRRMNERNDGPLSPRAVVYLAHEILSALEYAHDKRADDGSAMELVHRDVTPENVLVSARGEVKLLDFGIVKSAQGRVTRTEIGHIKGNVSFMSPEQARGRNVDRRSDLFSLGMVMYFAAAGRPLYEDGETAYDSLHMAAIGPGDVQAAAIASLPGPLPQILGRALAVDPDERYQTAADFRAALGAEIEAAKAELSSAIGRHFESDLQREQDRMTRIVTRPLPAHQDPPASSEAG